MAGNSGHFYLQKKRFIQNIFKNNGIIVSAFIPKTNRI